VSREWLDAQNVEGLQAGTLKEPAPARGVLRPLFIGYIGSMGIRKCIDKLARGDGSSLSGAVADSLFLI
jgi:hypothetical protein